ncbi:MAG: outer membrane protein assembly factor BamA [Candidatus Omnitrophota bacterium]|nr:MAG: outer membrane protein assembly factor BamA [Candidatus Omnitrophota bacterium]
MNNKHLPIILIMILLQMGFLAFFLQPVNAQEKIKERVVTDVVISGNRAVSTDTILLKIKTAIGRKLIQKQLNEDIKRLYATGFFTDVGVELEDYKEGTRVIFSVTEKAVIKKIIFQGNESIAEARLKKEIETKLEDVLSKRILASDVKKLKAYYRKKGFPLIEVDYKTEIDDENRAAVYIVIDEKIRYRIKEIEFLGNKSFNDKVLLKHMSTRTAGWFKSGILDKSVLEEDTEKIEAFYQSHGYIDAEADSRVEYKRPEKGIYITINIKEGLKYTVGEISLKGNLMFKDSKIFKELKRKKGDAYNPQQLRTDVIKIQTLYFDKGYMNCKVAPEVLLDKKTQSINITYVVTEGEIVYVNKIRITGNTKTKDVVIRRELRLYPGDKYEGEKLRRSKERLYNLGFFEEVIFDTEPTSVPDKKNLAVSIKEAKTGEFSFGGGYSSIDRLIGFVQIQQRNFDIMNFPTFTGAGQDLVLRGTFGSIRRNYELSFTEPWIFGYPLSFGFDLYDLQTLRKSALGYGYDEEHLGGALRLGKEFTDYDRADLKYTLEEVEISDVPDDASSALKNEEGKNTLSTLALTLTRDTRDNRFSPISGYLISGTFENGGGFIGGDKDFLKLNSGASAYFNYQKKLVLELKGRGGWVDEYDDSKSVPIYKRFFAGGANTVRGYKERSIGPRDTNTGDPIGGEAMLVGNVELTYPVFKNFKVATFYDVGNVWAESDDIGDGDFKSGIGVGVRVNTPIGPIKVDMGYPLDEAHPGDEKKVRFHFSMTRGF